MNMKGIIGVLRGSVGRLALSVSVLGILLAPGAFAANPAPQPAPSAPKVAQAPIPTDPVLDLITFSSKYATVLPLVAGQYDSSIARLAAHLLERTHYSRHAFDDEISARFLDRFLELLDPMHIHFLQPDLAEFERYRTKLDDLTRNEGDTGPANVIFARVLQRIEQRVEFVASLLQEHRFEFTGEDRYTPNRKDAAWPKDLPAAQDLWKTHLRYEYLQEKLNQQKPEEIVKTLSNRYKRLLRTFGEFDADEVLQFYLTALAQAYDPHSDYMGKAQLENFAISMKLSLFGIGALLRSEDGYCKIESLVAGGPAARSKKLKPGDRIIAVQQPGQEAVDVVDMKLTKVVEMIRGAKGTEVTLTVIPVDAADPAQRKVIGLVRDEIKLEDQEAKAKLIELPDSHGSLSRIGVIDLPSFYATFDLAGVKGRSEPKSTTEDVAKLIRKLLAEQVSGIVLDLRRNGGGSLEEAIRLTGLFIKEGPIVQVRDTSGDINVEMDPDPGLLYDGPLVVLTSRFSASASEILAAALQDYGRALVVGDRNTHGKGTVQTIYELGKYSNRFPRNFNPGALKVTIRKFYRATGSSTQVRGVTPDVVLPSVNNHMEVGEDSQDYALPWDTIAGEPFERENRLPALIEELRRRSEERQQIDPDFAYVREDAERFRKLMADKSVSLNEAARRKEKDENDARAKARKAERLARVESQAVTYEITLKLADTPGLPPPLSTNQTTAATDPTAEPASPTQPPTPNTAAPDLAQASTGAPAAVTSASAPTDNPDPEAEDEEDKSVTTDVVLVETKRILLDLAALLKRPAPTLPVAASK